jgi:hypothetical protein
MRLHILYVLYQGRMLKVVLVVVGFERKASLRNDSIFVVSFLSVDHKMSKQIFEDVYKFCF